MHAVCTLCISSSMIGPMEPAVSGCQAVERAITILELFDERRTVLAIGDVARALGVHRSTASRLMATLEHRGLLELDDAGGRLPPGAGPRAARRDTS